MAYQTTMKGCDVEETNRSNPSGTNQQPQKLKETKKTKKKPPKEHKALGSDTNNASITQATTTRKEMKHQPLPEGWCMAVDTASGTPHFRSDDVNEGIPTWDRPKPYTEPIESTR